MGRLLEAVQNAGCGPIEEQPDMPAGLNPQSSWDLVWDILPCKLFHFFVTCNHLVMLVFDQTFPLIFFRVLGDLILAPSKATSDLISYMARQLPKK